jgi:steroid delta-isomerase-like uncharacterized protein
MATALGQEQIEARLRIVEEHMRAENAHDVDAVMRTFVENPTFVLNGDTISGRDDVRAFYEGFGFGGGGGFADIHVEERRRHVGDDAIILEVTVTGEHADTWQGIPATGRRIEVPLCAVFPFDGEGRLTGERVYMDGALLLKQLGVLP